MITEQPDSACLPEALLAALSPGSSSSPQLVLLPPGNEELLTLSRATQGERKESWVCDSRVLSSTLAVQRIGSECKGCRSNPSFAMNQMWGLRQFALPPVPQFPHW